MGPHARARRGAPEHRHAARRRRRRRRLRLHPQGPPAGALRRALPGARAARPRRRAGRPRVPRRRRPRRALRPRGPRAGAGPGRALPRRAAGRRARHRARRGRRSAAGSCRSPTATSTSSTASSSTWPARCTTRSTARCSTRCSRDGELRAAWRRAPCTRAGHHAYLGGLLEHTVAVATLALEACQLHPRLNSDLLLCAAIVHDLGKTREFSLRRRDRAHRGGAAARPRRARPAASSTSGRAAWARRGGWRWRTAC